MTISEKYKSSRFNYFFQYGENIYLVFNTFKNKLYKISKECYEQICQKDEICYDQSIDKLLKENILVPVTEDENIKLYHLINCEIYNNKLEVSILPTQACNFRCTYCFEDHLPFRMTDESEKRIVKFFERNAGHYSSMNISWFGGEPLLEKQRVIRIMEAAKKSSLKYKIPLLSNMVTNGYELDYETFKSLVKNGVWEYQITLDGNKEQHDKNRHLTNGKGTFDTIVHNLIDIHHYPGSCRIIIRTNMDQNNVSLYPDFVNEMKKILEFDKRFEFAPNKIEDLGANIKNKELLLNEKSELPSYVNQQEIMRYDNIVKYRCFSGVNNGFTIAHDATIHKCRLLPYNTNPQIDKSYSCCGYISENGTLIMDESKNSKYISLPHPNESCKTCIWLPQCAVLTCPYYVAKNNSFKCRKYSDSDIQKMLIQFYENKVYIDISIC